jgi:hypothetical protein
MTVWNGIPPSLTSMRFLSPDDSDMVVPADADTRLKPGLRRAA